MIYSYRDLEKIEDRRVVLLNSGGLESCYLACLFHSKDFEVHHLFFDYGQNALEGETAAVHNIVKKYGGTLHTVKIDMPWLSGSSVLCSGSTVEDPSVPKYMGTVAAGTYVPLRNHVFLSIAGSLADGLSIPYVSSGLDGAQDGFGVPCGSAPDKHPNFAYSIEASINEASSFHHVSGNYIELICPILCMTKEDTILRGLSIGCDFSLSWSCYNSGSHPCGTCCACSDRKIHFDNVGIEESPFKMI